MSFEEFAKYLAGKDFDTLLHEAKADSEDRVLGQGIAYIALFISEMMMRSMVAAPSQAARAVPWSTSTPVSSSS